MVQIPEVVIRTVVADSQLASGSLQAFPLSDVTQPEFRRRRQNRRIFTVGLMLIILAAVIFNLAASGLLVPSQWMGLAIVFAVWAGATAIICMVPERGGPAASSLTITPDRIWFSAPKTADRALPIDRPRHLIILQDRDPSQASGVGGDRLPSGRVRFFVSIGYGWRTPVTEAAFRALQRELGRRGIPTLQPNRPPKAGAAGRFVVYRVPESPGAKV